jgi:uncharacterized protein (DUF2267 family)
MSNQTINLDSFYQSIMQRGNLRTPKHASRLTFAVLHTLGFNLSGGVKRSLAKQLPDDLAKDLTRGWRLINIRHKNLSLHDFAKDVARHSGNTDAQYAESATKVVFHQLKQIIDDDMIRDVARDISPEVRALWDAA